MHGEEDSYQDVCAIFQDFFQKKPLDVPFTQTHALSQNVKVAEPFWSTVIVCLLPGKREGLKKVVGS